MEAPYGTYKVSDLYTNQFYSFKTNPGASRENATSVVNIWEEQSHLIRVYGKVENLGDFLCPCFILSSGGKSVVVWYAPMENDSIKKIVKIDGIRDGDTVVVTGELRIDIRKSLYEFRAVEIEKVE